MPFDPSRTRLRLGRLVCVAALVCGMPTAVYAQANVGSPPTVGKSVTLDGVQRPIRFRVGKWNGRATADETTRLFSQCSAQARFAGHVTVTVMMTRLGDVSILFRSPYWRLRPGVVYPSGIDAAGAGVWQSLPLQVLDHTRVVMRFGNDRDVSRRVLSDGWLTLRLPTGVFELYLPDGSRLLRGLEGCISDSLDRERLARERARLAAASAEPPRCRAPDVVRMALPPQPSAAAQARTWPAGATAESAAAEPIRRTALPPRGDWSPQGFRDLAVRSLLRAAAIDAEKLPENVRAARFPNADQAWLAGQVYGTAAYAPDGAAVWERLADGRVSAAAFGCAGRFIQDMHGTQHGAVASVKRLFLTCEATRPIGGGLDGSAGPKGAALGPGASVLAAADAPPGAEAPAPPPAVSWFVTAVRRGEGMLAMAHCAEDAHLDAAFLADEQLATTVGRLLDGWDAAVRP